jgi:hypothetical protein
VPSFNIDQEQIETDETISKHYARYVVGLVDSGWRRDDRRVDGFQDFSVCDSD